MLYNIIYKYRIDQILIDIFKEIYFLCKDQVLYIFFILPDNCNLQ